MPDADAAKPMRSNPEAVLAHDWDRLRVESLMRVARMHRYLLLHPDATWGEVARHCG